ncbi:MAG: hypothetical protein GXY67_07770 [Clostridiales bacterium]|nr:hypothetical protein [Clostridiales bacterium]
MNTRMDTKEKRLAWREQALEAARKRGATVTHHPEADSISVSWQSGENRFELTIYDGMAYKPSLCCAFRTAQRMQEALDKHLQNRTAWLASKKNVQGKRKLSGQAQTATAIRETLIKHFPGVKFSVRSSSFSMGNDVTISWTDGPVADLVEHYAQQYAYGRFNAYEDYDYIVAIDSALGCPGAKYVSTSRTISPERRATIEAAAREASGGQLPLNHYRDFYPEQYEREHPELWTEEYRRELDAQREECKARQEWAEAKAAQEGQAHQEWAQHEEAQELQEEQEAEAKEVRAKQEMQDAEAKEAQTRQEEREARIFQARTQEKRREEALASFLGGLLGMEAPKRKPADVIDLAQYRQARDGLTLGEFADRYCKQ